MNSTQESIILMDSRSQALKIRILFWVLLIVGALALWGGWAIFQNYGLSEADGGVLKPLWQRLAFGGFIASLGLAAAGSMWLYTTLYVLRIIRSGDQVTITTMTSFGGRDRVFRLDELGEGAYYKGQIQHVLESGASGGIWVNAPWITLRAVGHRFPFIVDIQAEVIDIDAISVLAAGP